MRLLKIGKAIGAKNPRQTVSAETLSTENVSTCKFLCEIAIGRLINYVINVLNLPKNFFAKKHFGLEPYNVTVGLSHPETRITTAFQCCIWKSVSLLIIIINKQFNISD